jgi:outer membrane protein assembly factor BamB
MTLAHRAVQLGSIVLTALVLSACADSPKDNVDGDSADVSVAKKQTERKDVEADRASSESDTAATPRESSSAEPADAATVAQPDGQGDEKGDEATGPTATAAEDPSALAATDTSPEVTSVSTATAAGATASSGEWNQWGGSAARNNTPEGSGIPYQWNPGEFKGSPAEWLPDTAQNVKWTARLGSQSYGNPVVSGGKVFVGTNNAAGWLERYPADVDLGCLLAFRTADGEFLWQHSSEKLPTGRVHDWPMQGICCAPLVEGDRLWFVTSRGEVRCLDTEGFHDDENDGPYTDEHSEDKNEADVIWVLDMMKDLGVSQHNMCSCSVTGDADTLFVNTSNGVEESHILLPAPDAPSFIAVDKKTGEVLWTDKSPGTNILHGQWSSPAYAELGGVPQVLFGGGDGWMYSFHVRGTEDGKARLLWKFDCNPKESKWILGGRGTRNNIIATPVVHDGMVYVAVGQDPEHAEGEGHLWCIDPTKKLDGSDVSPQKVYHVDDPETPLPPRRIQSCDPEKGEIARDNPDSAAVWHYTKHDLNGDGQIDWEEEMHRSCGTVAIKDGLLFIADFSGLFHCLDAKTGQVHWTHDMLAACWGSPLIVDGKVYIGDEDGDVTIFALSEKKEILSRDEDNEPGPINMGNSVYSTPIVVDNVLYISNRTHLFAIAGGDDE